MYDMAMYKANWSAFLHSLIQKQLISDIFKWISIISISNCVIVQLSFIHIDVYLFFVTAAGLTQVMLLFGHSLYLHFLLSG